MKIAVCDDLEKDRKTICDFISHFLKSKNYDEMTEIKEYSCAEDFLKEKSFDFDIVFLDIYMDKMNGMECAQKLRDKQFNGSIVFSTTSQDFAIDAFKVRATDYLVKPYKYEAVEKTLNFLLSHNLKKLKSIEINSNYEKRNICLCDIYYIETTGRNTVIYTKNEQIRTIKTMQYFDDLLCKEKNFYRCHRCCIVNFSHISKCLDNCFEFNNNAQVFFKTRNKKETKNAYYDYQFDSLNNM